MQLKKSRFPGIFVFCSLVIASCGNGTDGDVCPSGQVLCWEGNSPYCVDLLTNDDHCGVCNNPCGLNEDCVNGQCTCVAGFSLCGDECVDLKHDPANCGTCGNSCASSEPCYNGACE